MIKDLVKRSLNAFGMDVVRYPGPLAKSRLKIMHDKNIKLLFDVGANAGQYCTTIRREGYKGKVVSFEPLTKVFKTLAAKAKRDNNWKALNIALGNFDGETEINISKNLASSSILDIIPSYTKNAPVFEKIGKEKIQVKKLDSVFKQYHNGENTFLKIDTQGFEKNVLEGAKLSLTNISVIQVEMSLVPVYSGQIFYSEMVDLLKAEGFDLWQLEPGYADLSSGRLLEMDGIFVKR